MELSTDSEKSDAIHIENATKLVHLKDYERAACILREVLDRAPRQYPREEEVDGIIRVRCWDDAEFSSYLAWMKQKADRREIKRLQNLYPRAAWLLSSVYAAQQKFDLAIEAAERGLSMQPGNGKLARVLGFALMRCGRSDEALSVHKAALSREGFMSAADRASLVNGTAHVLLIEKRQLDAAEALFREALSLDPNSDEARKGLETIANARARQKQAPQRPLLYTFQHVSLREAAFENHPELLRDLSSGGGPMPLLHFWSKALARCEASGFIPSGARRDKPFGDDMKLLQEVSIATHRRTGRTCYVVRMPATQFAPDAHFVAIVHKDDESHLPMTASPSTRYFTLERKSDPSQTALCEWRRDGSRANHGDGPHPDEMAFVDSVFGQIVRSQTRS